MAYTRRHFANLLQTGAAMAVAGFRPPSLEAMTGSGDTGVAFSSEHFARLVGSEFRVASQSGGHVALTLIAVEEIRGRRQAAITSSRKVDSAILRFSSAGSVLSAGIHRLAHEQNGNYDLYLSPGKPGRYLAYLCR